MGNRSLLQVLPLIGLIVAQVVGIAEVGRSESNLILFPKCPSKIREATPLDYAPTFKGEIPVPPIPGPPTASTITKLVQSLRRSTKSPSRCTVISKIVSIGEPTVPFLIPLLQDSNLWVRWVAIEALQAIGKPAASAIPSLIPLLQDPEETIRHAAAQAIGKMDNSATSAVPFLIPLLKDSSEAIRSTTAEALGEIGPSAKSAISFLIPLLKGVRPRSDEVKGR